MNQLDRGWRATHLCQKCTSWGTLDIGCQIVTSQYRIHWDMSNYYEYKIVLMNMFFQTFNEVWDCWYASCYPLEVVLNVAWGRCEPGFNDTWLSDSTVSFSVSAAAWRAWLTSYPASCMDVSAGACASIALVTIFEKADAKVGTVRVGATIVYLINYDADCGIQIDSLQLHGRYWLQFVPPWPVDLITPDWVWNVQAVVVRGLSIYLAFEEVGKMISWWWSFTTNLLNNFWHSGKLMAQVAIWRAAMVVNLEHPWFSTGWPGAEVRYKGCIGVVRLASNFRFLIALPPSFIHNFSFSSSFRDYSTGTILEYWIRCMGWWEKSLLHCPFDPQQQVNKE